MFAAFEKQKFVQLVRNEDVSKFQKEGKYMLYKINEKLDYNFNSYEYILHGYTLKIFPKTSLLKLLEKDIQSYETDIATLNRHLISEYQKGRFEVHDEYKNRTFFQRLKFLVSKK